MTVASDNVFPKLKVSEGTAWATPASGFGVVYEKTDGLLYFKNDAGTEYDLTSTGGAGSIPIFDEGVNKGTATAGFNFVGTLVSGTVNSGTAVITIATPPGQELDYVEITSNASATATTETTAQALITGNSVAYDGSTRVKIEAWFPYVVPGSGGIRNANTVLFADGTSIGFLNLASWNPGTVVRSTPVYGVRYLTPSAASHTYSIRGYVDGGTATWAAAAGGTGVNMPAFMRITKA